MLTTQQLERIQLRLDTCARCNHERRDHDDQIGCGAPAKTGRTCRCPRFIEWAQPRSREAERSFVVKVSR